MGSGHAVLVHYHKPEFLKRFEELLREARGDLRLLVCEDRDSIEKAVPEVDIIFAGSTFPLDVLDRATKLKWIQSMGAGIENFLRAGLIPPDVVLTRVRGVFGNIMSEYATAYIYAMTQKMPAVFENKRKKSWGYYLVDSIRRKTVGVMGLGSIGSTVAYRLQLTGAETIGFDGQERNMPFLSRVYGPSELEAFLKRIDFLVLCLPHTKGTEGILGARELGWMKDTAYLINIARGPLVDEKALLDALKNGGIAGAVLDVFNEEPLPESHPFWDLENVIITPHISGPSIPEEITEIFLRNLELFEKGAELEGVVDLARGY
jgi:phosphoglycerate dehydrogenase-like enzyme